VQCFHISKSPTRFGVPSRNACDFLPTANRDVDVERVQFDYPRGPTSLLGRQSGRAAATKWIEDDAVPPAAVADQIGD
jgi:hypothetical protein